MVIYYDVIRYMTPCILMNGYQNLEEPVAYILWQDSSILGEILVGNIPCEKVVLHWEHFKLDCV